MENKIFILGGDERTAYIVRYLSHQGFHVYVYGQKDHFENEANVVVLTSIILDSPMQAVVFPVRGVDDHGTLPTLDEQKVAKLTDDFWNQFNIPIVLFTGRSTPYLVMKAKEGKHTLIPLMEDEKVASDNAIPTAEGTLGLAISLTSCVIKGMNVDILGFGRCGKEIAHLFAAVGANVRIVARSQSALDDAFYLHYHSISLDDWKQQPSSARLIINTIPALVIDAHVLDQCAVNTVILDIASAPGGVDFAYAKEIGIIAMLAPVLPAKIAPETAGEILAKAIERELRAHER